MLPESDGARSRSDQRPCLHWFTGYPATRAPLPGDRDADVCIVGAGYTGLWTAYYLKRADPSLRIVVLEARFAGFGASGRNGGWLSGLVPGDRHRMAKRYGRDRVLAWQQALNDTVDEVIDVADREGIDAGIVKGGTLHVARNPAQASRLAAEVSEEIGWNVGGIAALTKEEAAQRIRLDGVVSAYHNPHCARVQPAWLVRGLADAVERLGVDIYETHARHRDPARAGCVTALGTVSAPVVLRATEGFTAALPGLRRRWLPMNSSMIATDPIPQADLGVDRLAGLRDSRRHRARILLRATHRRRPHRDRRAQRAVPIRFAHRCRRAGARAHHRAPHRGAALGAAADPRHSHRPWRGAACLPCPGTGRRA